MSKSKTKQRYQITNWAEYNQSLVNRGSVTIWVSPDVIKKWLAPKEKGKNGRPRIYNDEVILAALIIRAIYKLPLRALEGFLLSIVRALGFALRVPCYSQICRRAKSLGKILKKLSCRHPTDIVFDSTGLKVYGEGEWKVRVHGASKRRTWRKLHIAIDLKTREVVVAELTDHSKGDAQVAEKMLNKIHGRSERFYGDGAYDSHRLRQKIFAKHAKAIIPPRLNAVLSNSIDPAIQERNAAIAIIQGFGGDQTARALWKKLTGYHSRSIVENTMFRFKTFFGGALQSRSWENQQTEIAVKCLIINKMTRLGMPTGYFEKLKESA